MEFLIVALYGFFRVEVIDSLELEIARARLTKVHFAKPVDNPPSIALGITRISNLWFRYSILDISSIQ